MRITSEMMVTNSLRRLSTRLEHYEAGQSQLATGRRILAPSDDPGATGRALSLRAAQRARQQEARSAADARSWLGLADSQLQSAVERLHRVRDLVVAGASAVGAGERAAMAQEVRAVQAELTALANARHRGRPLFAGFRDVDAVAKVGGAWVYQGDRGEVTRRVGEQDVVRINVTADDVFGFSAGEDLFSLLDRVVAALEDGDVGVLAAAITDVDTARGRIHDAQTTVGAHANWVDSALRRSEGALLSLRSELAMVEDVDLAAAIMELQTQEVAYEASLQALARALPPSLVTFLR